MKIFKVLILLLIVFSCSKPKLGEIGNYQVDLGNSKADFHVLMWERGMKTKKEKIYASYSNNKIHFSQGVIAGKPLHGKYKEVGVDGELLVSGGFHKGLKNGYWTTYNKDGDLLSDLTFKEGDTISVVNFYGENKELKSQIFPMKMKLKKEKKLQRKEKRLTKKANCKAKYKSLFKRERKDSTNSVISPSDSTFSK